MAAVVLVTGGSGLVGSAIAEIVRTEPRGSRFGARDGEQWVFVGSKDADLRYGLAPRPRLFRSDKGGCFQR
jgi:uncharacterized protein YbjT (DUF2867 family)